MAEPQTKRVRLIDVAEKAGVSRIVAGHVLLGSGGKTTRFSEATAQRVRDAARDLDYRPNLIARQLSGVRTRTLAALIGANRYTVHYERLRAIDREADRRGYRLMVGYLHGKNSDLPADLLRCLDEMLGRGVEGVILMHRFSQLPKRVVERLAQTHIVKCQKQSALPDAFCIDVDLADGVEQLVDHLVERGRRRMVLFVDQYLPSQPGSRVMGFSAACKRHGIMDDTSIWSAEVTEDINEPERVRAHVERVIDAKLKTGKIDAIVASNDLWAVQIVKALTDRGIRVPHDIAVTGFDNVEIAAACTPELTTIDQGNDEFAAKTIDVLSRLIEGEEIPEDERLISIKPRLIVRQST